MLFKKKSFHNNDEELNLLSLAKLTTREILVEEQLDYLGESRYRSFKIYSSNQKTLKRKLITSKILGAFIFGILPIIPLLTYFQILDHIINNSSLIEIILLGGSLIVGLYFLLLFLNFFLMSTLNITRIMSGRIFEWYETLPISRDKIRKLLLLTIIRSSGIQLLVITFSLPLVMLIGTQNLIIFLVCLGVSILNTIFCFSIVIIYGEKLTNSLNINEIGSKKTHNIRIYNMILYIIIVIASIFLIQWAFSSLGMFFNWFEQFIYPRLLILIISMIPFPIAPSYLISSMIAPNRIPSHIWFNIVVGSGLFIILIWWIYNKSIKKIYIPKSKTSNIDSIQDIGKKIIPITIKTRKPIRVYLHKDLLIATRDLKTFLSLIMPIILSFLFMFTYNLSSIRGRTPLDIDFIYNWVAILGFNIIISGMLVYSLFNIEDTGNSIISSMPLIPRDQAKAKLFLMFSIQIITVLLPNLIYINSSKFLTSIINSVGALPFVLMFLFLMIDLRVYFFGKLKHHYVIEEVFPERRTLKWILILFIEYSIYFCILVFTIIINSILGVKFLLVMIPFVLLIGFYIAIFIFNKMFPSITSSLDTKTSNRN